MTTGAGGGEAIKLFILALNEHLYFFDRGCPSVTTQTLRDWWR